MTDKISFKKFKRLDLKVGEIKKAEPHPDADKLLVLTVDLGEPETRTIVAGIKNNYTLEELKGKQAIFVANLEPAKLRGVESNGMILAAVESEENIVILTPEKPVKAGTKVS